MLLAKKCFRWCGPGLKYVKCAQEVGLARVLGVRSASFTPLDNYFDNGKCIKVPEYLNFCTDVVDKWAKLEEDGLRKDSRAVWYIDKQDEETVLSYRDLESLSKRVATSLRQCGLQDGESLMVISRRIPAWWIVQLAAFRLGVTVSPASVQLSFMDLTYRLTSLKPECIAAIPSVAEKIDQLPKMHQKGIKIKILLAPKDVKREGWINFEEMVQNGKENIANFKSKSNSVCMKFFTSGTTGLPKLVEHTNASFILGNTPTGRFWMDVEQDSVLMNVSDAGWAKSAWSCLAIPFLHGCCSFNYESSALDPKRCLQVLQKYPVTTMCANPTGYRMLLKEESLGKVPFKALKKCCVSGELATPELIHKWKKRTGLLIYEGYGQTETTILVAMPSNVPFKAGSIGKPQPGVSVKIIANGKEAPTNEVGQISVDKKYTTSGLFTDYKYDKMNISRYFFTGDLGYKDKDGYFWYLGRNDDIIKSSGYRIGPDEVEEALDQHPAVQESAVISIADEEKGQLVKAFIILKEDFKSQDKEKLADDILNFADSLIASYKCPKKIEFVSKLPKTKSGKMQRQILRVKEIEKEWGRG